MTANHNRLHPARDGLGNSRKDDGFAEHSAAKDVSDLQANTLVVVPQRENRRDTYRAIGALPHLLELELLDTRLVRGDGRALDADLVLNDSVGSINSDFVVCLSRAMFRARQMNGS